MVDIKSDIKAIAAGIEAKAEAKAETFAGSAKAKFVSGWPFWAPVVILAALLGHAL